MCAETYGLDDEFWRDENDPDVIVIDELTGFYERKSECIKQNKKWRHIDLWDENPNTEWYRSRNED